MMNDDTTRSVALTRMEKGRFVATNARGGTLPIGDGGTDEFTPVELFLAAIAGCSAIDVDYITTKRAQPTRFGVSIRGDKIRDEHGNRLVELSVTFDVEFPDGAAGAEARSRLPQAVSRSHDRLCTVSRTVEVGTPVEMSLAATGGDVGPTSQRRDQRLGGSDN